MLVYCQREKKKKKDTIFYFIRKFMIYVKFKIFSSEILNFCAMYKS